MDLTCTVIVVEQYAHEDRIEWRQFGLLEDVITKEQPPVRWFEAIPSAVFDRAQFHQTLDDFRKQEHIAMPWG